MPFSLQVLDAKGQFHITGETVVVIQDNNRDVFRFNEPHHALEAGSFERVEPTGQSFVKPTAGHVPVLEESVVFLV